MHMMRIVQIPNRFKMLLTAAVRERNAEYAKNAANSAISLHVLCRRCRRRRKRHKGFWGGSGGGINAKS